MTGACNAAIQERIRFNSMNGYGSKLLLVRITILIMIQMNMKTPKDIINVQLPPKDATLSANR
jgi:hypothetical protein